MEYKMRNALNLCMYSNITSRNWFVLNEGITKFMDNC